MTRKFKFNSLSNSLPFLGFLIIAVFLIVWNVLLAHIMIDHLHMNDFGKFYFSIKTFLENGTMYGPNRATLVNVTPLFAQQFWNLNPPHFHLLIMPLGFVAPYTALAIWGLINLALLIASLQLIGSELQLRPSPQQSRLVFLGILAFSGTGAILITGQLTFLLLFPITLAWIQVRNKQWSKAGIALGIACSIKPFLLIFTPYFLLKHQYRALVLFILTCALTFCIGLLTLGTDIYLRWMDLLGLVDWSWTSMNGSIHGILNRAFHENPVFTTVTDAPHLVTPLWILLSGICAMITLVRIHQDNSVHSTDRSFLLLLLAAALISPLGWIYYLFLSVGPLTALSYQWWQERLSGNGQGATTLRNFLICSAGCGLIVPFQYARIFQPHGLATFTIGSIYFWSILAVWIGLIIDGHLSSKAIPQTLLQVNFPSSAARFPIDPDIQGAN